MHEDKLPTSHLQETIYLNASLSSQFGRSCLFEKIVAHPEFGKQFIFPARFPRRLDNIDKNIQRGQTCGPYGLSLGLYNGKSEIKIPFPRKNHREMNPDDKPETSLREMMKKTKGTAWGGVFAVEAFAKVTEKLGIKGCESIYFSSELEEYCKKIWELLQQQNTILISCDIDAEFPSNQTGENVHWALIFGGFSFKDHLYFLVAQYGQYYAWSAVALYASNQQLPEWNPHVGFYVKNGKYKYKISHDINGKYYCVTEDKLANFKFTGFAMPCKLEYLKSIEIENKEERIINSIKCASQFSQIEGFFNIGNKKSAFTAIKFADLSGNKKKQALIDVFLNNNDFAGVVTQIFMYGSVVTFEIFFSNPSFLQCLKKIADPDYDVQLSQQLIKKYLHDEKSLVSFVTILEKSDKMPVLSQSPESIIFQVVKRIKSSSHTGTDVPIVASLFPNGGPEFS